MEEKSDKATQSNLISDQELLRVPSSWFYTIWTEIPDETERSEVSNFLELQLEENSPFPIEQLAWNYLKKDNQAVIYAIPEKTLQDFVAKQESEPRWIIPGFLPFLWDDSLPKEHNFYHDGNDALLFHFQENDLLPRNILATSESANPEIILQEQAVRYRIALPDDISVRFQSPLTASWTTQRRIIWNSQEEKSPALITEVDLLTCDLRESTIRQAAIQASRSALWAWRGALGLAATFTLLLLFQGGLWWRTKQVESLTQKFNEQEPPTQLIAEKQELVRKLEEAASAPLQPFGILGSINTFRPKTIHFTDAAFSNTGQIKIDGNATSFEEVNRYFADIKEIPEYQTAELSNLERRDQRGVRFKLTFNLP